MVSGGTEIHSLVRIVGFKMAAGSHLENTNLHNFFNFWRICNCNTSIHMFIYTGNPFRMIIFTKNSSKSQNARWAPFWIHNISHFAHYIILNKILFNIPIVELTDHWNLLMTIIVLVKLKMNVPPMCVL